MDRRAWRATVHGVEKSLTRLKRRTHLEATNSSKIPPPQNAMKFLQNSDPDLRVPNCKTAPGRFC